jgi:hypothetical protein
MRWAPGDNGCVPAYPPEPWIATTPATDALLDDLADQCRALVLAWHKLGRRLGEPRLAAAPAVRDEEFFLAAAPDAPAGLGAAPGVHAGLYVSSIGQHLKAVSVLLDAREVTVPLWPLVRAELEVAGRVGWILDPGDEGAAVNGMQRVARFYIESLSSIQRARYTAKRTRRASEAKLLKEARTKLVAEIEGVFPHFEVPMDDLKLIEGWTIGSEENVGLGLAADNFARARLGGGRGMYDIQSDFSHPSLYHLGRATRYVDIGGMVELRYEIESATIEWQVQVACLVLYAAAHHLAGYYGLDGQELEDWAEACATRFAGWFVASPEPSEPDPSGD